MTDAPAAYRLLADRFGEDVEIDRAVTLDDVRRFVAKHVARLLDQNPGLLMSILYRVDVAEESVQKVLTCERHEDIPHRLADLIVQRQLEKTASRRRYRNDDRA